MGDEMSRAVLDFTGDDDQSMRSLKSVRRWDRKKKKFVVDSCEGKAKKVKTESGNWIPASYQSKLWVRKEKVEDNNDSDDDNHHQHHGHHKQQQRNKHKLQILGTKRRGWHTKGTETADKQGKVKNKFKAKRELKDKDRILSNRKRKAKVEAFQKHRQVVRSKKRSK